MSKLLKYILLVNVSLIGFGLPILAIVSLFYKIHFSFQMFLFVVGMFLSSFCIVCYFICKSDYPNADKESIW